MTRRRPRAWPTVAGAIALFAIVFQLLLFQATPGGVSSLVRSISLDGDDGTAKSTPAVSTQSQTPAAVVTASS